MAYKSRQTWAAAAAVLLLLACSDPASAPVGGAGASGNTVAFDSGGLTGGDGTAQSGADAKAAANDGGPGDAPRVPDLATGDSTASAVDTEPLDSSDSGPAALPDATMTGNVGAPCTAPSDCDGGQCVESADGKVCAKLCEGACDTGYTCAGLKTGGGDLVYVCVPTFARLCNPCANHADCNPPGVSGGLCLPKGKDGNDGSFCAIKCAAGKGGACPSGFACMAALGGFACLPQAGVCTCSPAAAAQALSTACAKQNDVGLCLGTRACGPNGLTACSAASAAAESCNGLDDDCNGKTDDIAAAACEAKNEFGTCAGKVGGCNGGAPVCSAPQPKPETCNQLDDDCDGQTDEDLCDDGNACTQGTCNPDGSCKQSPKGGPCDDANVCTGDDSCANGACQGSKAKVCDDGNACTVDLCDPKTGCAVKSADPGVACDDDANPCTVDQCQNGKCAHTPAPGTVACADDGNVCTLDQCSNGTCAHPAAPGTVACADDGNACTLDQCANGQCDHPTVPAGTACPDDGNACTDDVCQGSGCAHPAAKVGTGCPDDGDLCTTDTCNGSGVCTHAVATSSCKIGGKCVAVNTVNPANACEICDPKVTQAAWVPKDGLACSDGNPCTTGDTCKAGKCGGTAKSCAALDATCATGTCNPTTGACAAMPKAANTSCSDGNPCTTADVCNGTGTCAGKAVDCGALTDGCNTGVCSAGSCLKQQKPTNTACNDNDACTTADVCTAGTCKGKALDCASKTDACNTGQCSSGACVAMPKADNTVCSDGSPCTVNDACKVGKCTGTSTADTAEPNNSSPGKTLVDKSDCDNLSQMTATISPVGDVDWYVFNSKDDAFCTVKPQAKIENLAADYDLCVYFECANGKTGSGTVDCANGSKVSSGGPNNSAGCCSTNTGTTNEFAKVSPQCSTLGTGNDGGKTWVKVTAKAGATCGGYTLYWGAKN
ncbi:MAG: hypothetical protein FJ100_11465 [Deltaproteobacteria bacterium]|nr:hypothetical protein [Deltaproteobacteria bacterium]